MGQMAIAWFVFIFLHLNLYSAIMSWHIILRGCCNILRHAVPIPVGLQLFAFIS